MKSSQCPLCFSDIIIEDGSDKGDLITCSNCEEELEIISLHPLQLTSLADNTDIDQIA